MDLRNTLILLVFLSAFLTGTVVSTAPRAAQRDDRVAAEDMAREAIEQLMRALELRLLQPWVRSVEGWRVVDVGSGHGFYSLDPARRGARQVSCDLEPKALSSARQIATSLGVHARALLVAADG